MYEAESLQTLSKLSNNEAFQRSIPASPWDIESRGVPHFMSNAKIHFQQSKGFVERSQLSISICR